MHLTCVRYVGGGRPASLTHAKELMHVTWRDFCKALRPPPQFDIIKLSLKLACAHDQILFPIIENIDNLLEQSICPSNHKLHVVCMHNMHQ